MDIVEELQAIAARIPKVRGQLLTEEATKTALVLPFIRALGYDFMDPTEVVPEYHADVPGIKGERADYAIMLNGVPIIMFECKPVGAELGNPQHTQLFRYFTSTPVRVGILTNGVVYEFYSDLDTPNRMDVKPFMILDLLAPDLGPLTELQRLAKGAYNEEEVVSTAAEMKYNRELQRFLTAQFAAPGEDFAKMLIASVYQGKLITQKVRDQFMPVVLRALQQFVADQVNERLRAALSRDGHAPQAASAPSGSAAPATTAPPASAIDMEKQDGVINTTVEEIEGYMIVKSLVRGTVAASRVTKRDQASYCGILLDDNNRKVICRLWFNRTKKYVSLFDVVGDDGKAKEEKVPIERLDDMFGLGDRLLATIRRYDQAKG